MYEYASSSRSREMPEISSSVVYRLSCRMMVDHRSSSRWRMGGPWMPTRVVLMYGVPTTSSCVLCAVVLQTSVSHDAFLRAVGIVVKGRGPIVTPKKRGSRHAASSGRSQIFACSSVSRTLSTLQMQSRTAHSALWCYRSLLVRRASPLYDDGTGGKWGEMRRRRACETSRRSGQRGRRVHLLRRVCVVTCYERKTVLFPRGAERSVD